ncbi:AspT/YidE/YbjL antiporter-like protein [Parabacteroides sp. PF5-5]|uniref:putative transporter n=1 Tax=unclassified Parabacteroides TaxID=2649774 RepID=UPI0024764B39|nr:MULTISPECIES: putative transporter [unclassified Parabacteroides]MDH6305011.1 AspT/YidE/YbjL antiporter-like protein [Parabacteroides sp. PH5-39]MDH6315904.1 AspT/YidE/YbjL antiporter-like protein [Parabacteroides sp. PF5-13]MDH6319561.1 AspT/YidE/YbjL antiporter-like protein [Parabacteroides sp. PH5-13]MDH6323292.1 AspT/YidE/YbjL antiporter-like protein [Parabacteroides sp. PH5-8]MDH6327200.1 AspT/YidE/YbjL antiporter-like protein [Parabacteroides sp. PH5-41]
MDWLREAFLEPSAIQAIIVIALVSAVGLSLGRIKIFGISLGITFVFFVGIVAGHFGIVINQDMLTFVQNFGLILFVYTLGLQVGPSFFSSFRKEGVTLNMLAIGVVFTGLLLTLLLHQLTGISVPKMMGLLSGAVTNTPVLGAAQQALLQKYPTNIMETTDMALACAVAYPLGVIGVILAIIVMQKISKEEDKDKKEQKAPKPNVAEFQLINPAVFNKSIKEVMQLSGKHFVISRIWRDRKVTIPTSDTVLKEGDHLLVISVKADVESIKALFGEQEDVDWNKEDVDWNAIDSHLVSRRIVVTRSKVNGAKLGSLRLRNLYGINITRVNRAGIDLLASSKLRLQIGDRLTIVGESAAVNNVGKILGDEVKRLTLPNLFAIFFGIFLGVLLGVLPITLPGMSTPVKLGIAGGPIIIGILMGTFGPRLKVTTYTTQSANLMMRQFGIVIYLAGLGVSSGAHFFETVFRTEGLIWIGLGFLLTMVPVLIIGFLASFFLKIDYGNNIGMLCGSMANPMALNYANNTVDNDDPSVSYATVYPLSMFLRVITAQLMILLFA